MARISGVDLPNNKRIEIALTYIYGIGRISATKIVEQTKIDPDLRAKNLSDEQIS
jgi:small subunit ribosomal protein S13